MRMLNDNMAQCPECGCPIQRLADGVYGMVKGTFEDAMEAHNKIVHPAEEPK